MNERSDRPPQQTTIATPARSVSPLAFMEAAARREPSGVELIRAAVEGKRFDHQGNLRDPAGAPLGAVR